MSLIVNTGKNGGCLFEFVLEQQITMPGYRVPTAGQRCDIMANDRVVSGVIIDAYRLCDGGYRLKIAPDVDVALEVARAISDGIAAVRLRG